jgi:hypothetical protein
MEPRQDMERRDMDTHLDEQYHEGSEQAGLLTLAGIIFGLLLIGLLLFALTWALAK